jgi:hypothetical protein
MIIFNSWHIVINAAKTGQHGLRILRVVLGASGMTGESLRRARNEGLREPIAGSQRRGGLESTAEDEAQMYVLHHHFAAVE